LNVVEEVIAINQADASRKGLALSLKHPDIDLPLVAVSKTVLIQVLQNLVNNAIKFTDRGGVAFEVQLDGKFVKIVIEDTGMGINSEDIPKLFKQFSQLEAFGSRPLSGTGLGLYISAQLVESFGGQIGLESSVGVGSKFSVTLPFGDIEKKD
jgi:signal transduction histidine kinase